MLICTGTVALPYGRCARQPWTHTVGSGVTGALDTRCLRTVALTCVLTTWYQWQQVAM